MAYVPEKHKKYGLLPLSAESDSEVFSYPSDLVDAIERILFELEGIPEDSNKGRVSLLIPYAFKSYKDYQGKIESYIEKYPEHEVADLLKLLSQQSGCCRAVREAAQDISPKTLQISLESP